MSELLSVAQMARRAGVTQQWLRKQAEAGSVPCLMVGQRRYLFSPSAVMDVLSAMATGKEEDGR